MLTSLHIKNYRNLKDFKIKNLAQVNLITGKNNTGKSSILEAMAIYASKGDINLIKQLLEKRGEIYTEANKLSLAEANLKSLSCLFTDRLVGFSDENTISIGEENADKPNTLKPVTLKFIRIIFETTKDNNKGTIVSGKTISDDDIKLNNIQNYNLGFISHTGAAKSYIPLSKPLNDNPYFNDVIQKDNYQYVNTALIDRDINGTLFDQIALSDKEAYVIEALQIIEPKAERIAFVEEKTRERKAVIKLSGVNQTLPLRSMGDGINRILTIILALVNASDGYLLIDEFENGLHYTVQEKIWKIIFNLAKKLNVQVLVTTHSNDCIAGFEQALNNKENSVSGKLIRLDNENGIIKEVEFTAEELKIAEQQNIEIR